MEQAKKSTFKLLFYLKKNEPKKNGNAPIMARITIDGTPKTLGTKLEINPNNWDLKYGRVEGKSAKALGINQKLDNIRARIGNKEFLHCSPIENKDQPAVFSPITEK